MTLRLATRRSLAAMTAGLVVAITAADARAQEGSDEVVRRELIAEAERARLAGDHATAAERARRAVQIRATPSAQYFLAREYEALGQRVETIAQAGACARGAEADATLRNRDVLVRACRAIVARNERRVARITVHIEGTPPPAGVSIRVAGNALPDAAWGVPWPVASGVIRLEAEAPAHDPWQRDVTVSEGESIDVPITLRATPPTPPPPPASPSPTAPPPPSPPPSTEAPIARDVPRVAPRDAPPVAAPLALGVAGATSLLAAGALFAVAASARGDRDTLCPDGACDDPSARSAATTLDSRYRATLLSADVALGVGLATLAGASLWWLLPRVTRAARPTVRASITPDLAGGGRAAVTVVW